MGMVNVQFVAKFRKVRGRTTSKLRKHGGSTATVTRIKLCLHDVLWMIIASTIHWYDIINHLDHLVVFSSRFFDLYLRLCLQMFAALLDLLTVEGLTFAISPNNLTSALCFICFNICFLIGDLCGNDENIVLMLMRSCLADLMHKSKSMLVLVILPVNKLSICCFRSWYFALFLVVKYCFYEFGVVMLLN